MIPGPSIDSAIVDFLARGGDQYPFRGASFTALGVSYQQALPNYIQDALGGAITAADYPEGVRGGYVFDRGNLTNFDFFFNAVPLSEGDCLMHKQASFFAVAFGIFGYDLEEFSTFKFPAVNPEFADSAMGGGVYISALNERAEVRQLTRYMLSQRFGRTALADLGGWLLPNVRFDLDRYGDDLTRSFAEIVQAAIAAGQFRFDASDLMPPEIGGSPFAAFWIGIVDLLLGARTIPEVLADIDAAWPS